MEMDLRTSGALSRAHFALVQQVENAPSPQVVDTIIRKEISGIRARLQNSSTSSRQAAECLILLLYCQSVAPYPIKTKTKFALAHAVKLAEGGETLRDRRIAYQYCIQTLPPDHDLHLMLVNTIRKDLSSSHRPRIALALDYVTQSPGVEVIPAIQDRIRELLSHKSHDIQRRTLLAIRSLSSIDAALPHSMEEDLITFARGAKLASAALAIDILAAPDKSRQDSVIMELLLQQLDDRSQSVSRPTVTLLAVLSRLLECVEPTIVPESAVNSIITLLQRLSPQNTIDTAVLLASFTALSHISPSVLVEKVASAPGASPLQYLRPLLNGQASDPNSRYLAMKCLLLLHPSLWTGVSAQGDADEATRKALTIGEQEVGVIMGFMESDDSSLRSLTYKVLNKVDPNILRMYRDQLLAAISSPPPRLARSRSSSRSATGPAAEISTVDLEQKLLRIMEIFDVISAHGDLYAADLKRLLAIIGSAPPGSPVASPRSSVSTGRPLPVLEAVVERTLYFLDAASTDDQKLFIDSFVDSSPANTEPETDLLDGVAGPSLFLNRDAFNTKSTYGPTGLTILAATACAYGDIAKTTPEALLLELNGHLMESQPAVQEALLLAITRIMARCTNGLPSEVAKNIDIIRRLSGRHIQMRCQQVIEHSRDIPNLKRIIASAHSSSLPDFVMALESHRLPPAPHSIASPSPSHTTPTLPPSSPPPFATSTPVTSPRMAASKLRYDPYEAPIPTLPRSAYRNRSGSTTSAASSPRSVRSPGLRRLDDRYDDEGDDPMARTMTAGELALAGTSKAWLQADVRSGSREGRRRVSKPLEEAPIEKFELITLGSPFHADAQLVSESPSSGASGATAPPPTHQVFEAVWAALDSTRNSARGWCSSPPSAIGHVLQAAVPQYTFVVAPDVHNPFIEDLTAGTGEVCALIRLVGEPDYVAAVKLKPAEDNSCMWQLRTKDVQTRVTLKEALE